MRSDRRADRLDRHLCRVDPAGDPPHELVAERLDVGVEACGAPRVARPVLRSGARGNAREPSTSSAPDRPVSTRPSRTVMIGFIDNRPPIAAWAALIRPPFLRYSSVSTATYRSMSAEPFLERRGDLAAETPAAASRAPSWASIPDAHRRRARVDDVDLALREHVAGDARALDRPRQRRGRRRRRRRPRPRRPRSTPRTRHGTRRDWPRRSLANGAPGATMRSQNCSVVRSTPARKCSIAEATPRAAQR